MTGVMALEGDRLGNNAPKHIVYLYNNIIIIRNMDEFVPKFQLCTIAEIIGGLIETISLRLRKTYDLVRQAIYFCRLSKSTDNQQK